MLTLSHVTKKYKGVCALNDVSFQLDTGVYGLIGENGAGKTTIMKILTRQIAPDSGKIMYRDLEWNDACKLKVGYLPQNFDFFENLTLVEALEYLLLVRGENPDTYREELKLWLEYLNLTEHAGKKIKKLSGGMRQRMGIVQAFLGNPELILLDEPTVGLDPKERLAFRNMVNEVCDNKTILISTHILDDIESTCEKMISLQRGVVTYEGKIQDYINSTKEPIYTVMLTKEEFRNISKGIHVIAMKREGEQIKIRFVIRDIELMKKDFRDRNLRIGKMKTSLEDAYFIHMYLKRGKRV